MAKEKLIGKCCGCKIVFQFETTDIFSGETFCPICVSRVKKENKFSQLKEAKQSSVGFRILR